MRNLPLQAIREAVLTGIVVFSWTAVPVVAYYTHGHTLEDMAKPIVVTDSSLIPSPPPLPPDTIQDWYGWQYNQLVKIFKEDLHYRLAQEGIDLDTVQVIGARGYYVACLYCPDGRVDSGRRYALVED